MQKNSFLSLKLLLIAIFSIVIVNFCFINSYAENTYEWKKIDTQVSKFFTSIAYGDNKIVVVGQDGLILVSDAKGENWRNVNSNIIETLSKVIYANNQFIAVGSGGGIYCSTDGETWVKQFAIENKMLQSICYANSTYIAVGDNVILYSTDTLNWIEESYEDGYLNDIIWGNNEFVAVGGGSNALISKDGLNWTKKGADPYLCFDTVAWGNSGYVTGGMGTSLAISSDGNYWSSKITQSNSTSRIIWNNNQYVGLLWYGMQDQTAVVGTSNDGVNWESILSLPYNTFVDILCLNGRYIVVGAYGEIYNGTNTKSTEDISNIVSIHVDGQPVCFPDLNPFIDGNNRTMVPVRFLSQALGAEVNWNEAAQTVEIQKEGKNINLKVGENEVVIDSKKITLDSPARLVNGRVVVPLRFVSECFGAKIGWDKGNNLVTIENKPQDTPSTPTSVTSTETTAPEQIDESAITTIKEALEQGKDFSYFNQFQTGTALKMEDLSNYKFSANESAFLESLKEMDNQEHHTEINLVDIDNDGKDEIAISQYQGGTMGIVCFAVLKQDQNGVYSETESFDYENGITFNLDNTLQFVRLENKNYLLVEDVDYSDKTFTGVSIYSFVDGKYSQSATFDLYTNGSLSVEASADVPEYNDYLKSINMQDLINVTKNGDVKVGTAEKVDAATSNYESDLNNDGKAESYEKYYNATTTYYFPSLLDLKFKSSVVKDFIDPNDIITQIYIHEDKEILQQFWCDSIGQNNLIHVFYQDANALVYHLDIYFIKDDKVTKIGSITAAPSRSVTIKYFKETLINSKAFKNFSPDDEKIRVL